MLKHFTLLVFVFLFINCATFKSSKNVAPIESTINLQQGTNVFLIGDAGKLENGSTTSALAAMKTYFTQADGDDILLFLGDNIYQSGLPEKQHKDRKQAEAILKMQLNTAKEFPGKTIFIPGNHDWYSGLDGLKRQEEMVEKALGKSSFLPENGCPLEEVEINDEMAVIIVDSEWYLTNWDKHPDINEKCGTINSRAQFWIEFGDLLKDNQNKTTIVAIHHPLFSNGQHNGQYPMNLFFMGNFLRRVTGVVPADIQYPLYKELVNRMTTVLGDYKENTIIVSGHEHNLQYIEQLGIKQIVSGAGAKTTALKVKKPDFGFAGNGFAVLNIADSSQTVIFYNVKGQAVHQVKLRAESNPVEKTYPSDFEQQAKASIYPEELFKKLPKGGGFNGERYREYYGKDYQFPIADLDTLYGGLTPVQLGGGFQSVTVRLEDKEGKEYKMRRLRKSASQFIQKELFKETYVKQELKGTATEALIFDFYTTAYPFAFLITGQLAETVNVYHSNPKVFYVPKQAKLGRFNAKVGDDLYMIEEHAAKEWKDLSSFGSPDDIEGSADVIEKILENTNNTIDKVQFIRTRLFDMWLNDWDRHYDQYRWAQYEGEGGIDVFQAIPRDRDQAFPKYDGLLLKIATSIVPELRKMQSIQDDIKSIKYLNYGNYKYDLMFLGASNLEDWEEQAVFLQQHLTDEVIEKAFKNLPETIQDKTAQSIVEHLKKRRNHIGEWAKKYYKILNKKAVITATQKDDFIDITRNDDNSITIKLYRNKSGKRDDMFVNKTYYPDTTKEIWVYGLDDKDKFTVTGKKTKIKLHLIGGDNNDTYNLSHKNKIAVYDNELKKSTFIGSVPQKNITANYEKNNFNLFKFQHNTIQSLPLINYDPDRGVQFGLTTIFNRQDFSQKEYKASHRFSGKFHSATGGFDLGYQGNFKNVFRSWAFQLQLQYTTPAYSENFFGYGNTTVFDKDNGIAFYRVRQEKLHIQPVLMTKGKVFSEFKMSLPFDRINVENNTNRFVNDYFEVFGRDYLDSQNYLGVEIAYLFKNFDENANPTLGLEFELKGGYKTNLENSKSGFGYISPSTTIVHPVTSDGKIVLSTKLSSAFFFSNDIIPFYFAPAIGGKNGLRGYRNERFTADNSFFQNTDLRFHLADISTFLLPAKLGFYGGFDYGKVWLNNTNYGFVDLTHINNTWHTSYGGGIYLNGTNLFTFQAGYFGSQDGGRLTAGLGFDF